MYSSKHKTCLSVKGLMPGCVRRPSQNQFTSSTEYEVKSHKQKMRYLKYQPFTFMILRDCCKKRTSSMQFQTFASQRISKPTEREGSFFPRSIWAQSRQWRMKRTQMQRNENISPNLPFNRRFSYFHFLSLIPLVLMILVMLFTFFFSMLIIEERSNKMTSFCPSPVSPLISDRILI